MRYAVGWKRNAAVLSAAILLATTSLACSGNTAPKLSPIGQVAVQGDAVVKAADAVVTGIDNALTAKQLPQSVGVPVLQTIRVVGVQAQDLADALKVANLAKTAADQQKGVDAARAALATIQASLAGALSQIKDQATKDHVSALLQQLTDAVQKVQLLIGAVGGAVQPVEEPQHPVLAKPAWTLAV